MKRKRVEEAPMRLAKRVASEHDEAVTAEPQVVALMDADRPRPDRQNGVAFLKMVKDTLKNEVERYDSFVKVMANYKRGIIGTREVIRRVKVLFKKHPNLILGFNIFLQPSDRIEVPAQDGVDVDKLKVALKFVNKVKVRFTSEEGVQVYRRFLGILRAFKVGMSVKEVYDNIVTLFRGHDDLLVEFRDFLPARSLRNWVSLVASVVQNSTLAPLPPATPPSSLNQGSESSHREPEPAQEEFPAQPPPRDNNNTTKYKPGAQEQEKTSSAPGRTLTDKEATATATTDAPRRIPRKAGGEVDKEAKKVDKPESNGAKSGGVGEEHENGEEKVRRGRQKRATPAPSPPAVQQKRRRRGSKKVDESEQLAFFESVSKELEGSPVYKELFQSMNLCRRQIVTSPQLHKLVSDVLKGHPHHRKAFHRCFPDDKDESDLLLQRWQTCTPSYRLDESVLSEKPAMSSDSEQESGSKDKGPYSNRKILNKTWVTITTGGNAFTSQESNRYEEVLFQCEDDQYELDMLMETTRSTARKLSQCIEMLKHSPITQFSVDEHLSPVHLRCIERIYNPIYPTLLVHTRDNPGAVLPVVLSRLEQRLQDWASMRTHLNPLWAQVRAANHSKSLVYESDLEMGEDENDDGEYVEGEVEVEEECEEDEDDDEEYTLDSEDQDEVLEAAEYPVEGGDEAANEDPVVEVGSRNEAQAGDEAEGSVEDAEKVASQDEAQDVVENGEEVEPQDEELDAAENPAKVGEEVVVQDEAQGGAEKGNESEEEAKEVKTEVKTQTTKAEDDGVGGAKNGAS